MTTDSDDWTVERHLRDKPAEVVALYHRCIELATACGPLICQVGRGAHPDRPPAR